MHEARAQVETDEVGVAAVVTESTAAAIGAVDLDTFQHGAR